MNMKQIHMFTLVCVLILSLAVLSGCGQTPAQTQPEETTVPVTTQETETTMNTSETIAPLPDSVLYYGEIKKIMVTDEGFTRLSMESQRSGPYIMNLSENTRYVNSGHRSAFDPAELQEGDRVYVFHSPISFRSMPPQTEAFVILRDIPMDASCGMYHKVEDLREEGDQLLIVTDNGSKILSLSQDAQVLTYEGETADRTQITKDSHVIAWYWDQGQDMIPASHIMLLP